MPTLGFQADAGIASTRSLTRHPWSRIARKGADGAALSGVGSLPAWANRRVAAGSTLEGACAHAHYLQTEMGIPAPGHPLGVRFGYGVCGHAVRHIAMEMEMDRTFSRIGLAAGAAGLLATAFTQIYAPLRAKRLATQYARFRAEHQAEHDAIDAQFNQQDRVVNGLNWH